MLWWNLWLLKSSNPNTRIRAAQKLSKLKDLRAVEALVNTLRCDYNENVLNVVVELLGETKDKRAVNLLIDELKRTESSFLKKDKNKIAAAQAIAKIGDIGVVDSLVLLLESSNKIVRQSVANTLNKFDYKPANNKEKILFYTACDRWDLVEKLGIDAVQSLNELIELDYKYNLSTKAIESLGNIGEKNAIESLLKLLHHVDRSLRKLAIETLDKVGWQPESETHRIQLEIALCNWESLIQFGEKAVEPLNQILNSKWDYSSRNEAAKTLRKIGGILAQDILKKWESDKFTQTDNDYDYPFEQSEVNEDVCYICGGSGGTKEVECWNCYSKGLSRS